MRKYFCALLLGAALTCGRADDRRIPVSAPMTTDLAGKSGGVAAVSVYRVVCPSANRTGTAFLHKSGQVLTAAHVVTNCEPSEIKLLTAMGQQIAVTNVVADYEMDVALLFPAVAIHAGSLGISTNDQISIGKQVSTWGFPVGYDGLAPLLSSGYLSGIQQVRRPSGQIKTQLVVNAAFNRGNSGGPLIDIESGRVAGMVVSKLAPIPAEIEGAMEILRNEKGGYSRYVRKYSDGREERISEAQLVGAVVDYLRSQVQLVIGTAVTSADLRGFLKTQGLEP